jgi:hypothetical protein
MLLIFADERRYLQSTKQSAGGVRKRREQLLTGRSPTLWLLVLVFLNVFGLRRVSMGHLCWRHYYSGREFEGIYGRLNDQEVDFSVSGPGLRDRSRRTSKGPTQGDADASAPRDWGLPLNRVRLPIHVSSLLKEAEKEV